MAISYHIYSNDGRGGAIDYLNPIATVPAALASPLGSFTAGPLAMPSDNLFAVRAFDDVSGVEEANTDARVHIVIDATGQDVSSQPNGVMGLAVRWTVGNVALVSWNYTPAGQGGAPTRFDVSASPITSGPFSATTVAVPGTQSVNYVAGVAGYGCRLGGLTTAIDWSIQVRAVGGTDLIVGPAVSASLARQSGSLAAVDRLVAVASA